MQFLVYSKGWGITVIRSKFLILDQYFLLERWQTWPVETSCQLLWVYFLAVWYFKNQTNAKCLRAHISRKYFLPLCTAEWMLLRILSSKVHSSYIHGLVVIPVVSSYWWSPYRTHLAIWCQMVWRWLGYWAGVGLDEAILHLFECSHSQPPKNKSFLVKAAVLPLGFSRLWSCWQKAAF